MAPGRHSSFDSLSSNASRVSIKRALRQSSWRTTHSDCPMDSAKISKREVARLRYLEYFTIGGNEFPSQGLECPFPPCELVFSSLSEIASHMQMCPTIRETFRCPTCSRLHDLHSPTKSEPRKRRASIIQDGKRILQKMKRGVKSKKIADRAEKASPASLEASPSEYTLGSALLQDDRHRSPSPLHIGHSASHVGLDTATGEDVVMAHAGKTHPSTTMPEVLYPAELISFQSEERFVTNQAGHLPDASPPIALEHASEDNTEMVQLHSQNVGGFLTPAKPQLHLRNLNYTESITQKFRMPSSIYDEQFQGHPEALRLPEPGGWGLDQMGTDDLVTSATVFTLPTGSTLHTEANPFEAEMIRLLEKEPGTRQEVADSTSGYCLPPSTTTADFPADITSRIANQFQPNDFNTLPNCGPTNLLLAPTHPGLHARPANTRQVSSESCKTLVDSITGPDQPPFLAPTPSDPADTADPTDTTIPDPILDEEGHCACPIEDCKYSSRSRGTREEHRLSKYRRHWRNQHGKKPPVYCPVCSRQFSRRDNMRKHLKSQSCDGAGVASPEKVKRPRAVSPPMEARKVRRRREESPLAGFRIMAPVPVLGPF